VAGPDLPTTLRDGVGRHVGGQCLAGRRKGGPDTMAKVLTVLAGKGGVGKSTTIVNVAAALAEIDQRVCVVDADAQGAAAQALGILPDKPTLYEALYDDSLALEAITPTSIANVDLLPADKDLAGATVELPQQSDWQLAMRRVLEPLRARYQWILLDTPPGLGVLSYASLIGSDDAMIACEPQYLSYATLPAAREQVEQAAAFQAARGIVPQVRLLGIVLTLVHARIAYKVNGEPLLEYEGDGDARRLRLPGRITLHEREILTALLTGDEYRGFVLCHIPERAAINDAVLAGEPVLVRDPRSDGAHAFRVLAKGVIDRGR
jgi:chromosome partitioning protein